MITHLRRLPALILLCAALPALASPILMVDGAGLLTGAKGVDVAGTLYDVTFAEGSCASIFNGCNDNTAFVFNNADEALVGAQALLDQVFIDGPQGQFDSLPNRTLGCYAWWNCATLVPYANHALNNFISAENSSTDKPYGLNDGLGAAYFDQDVDSALNGRLNYGVFRLAAVDSNIPEPGTTALFGIAVAAPDNPHPARAKR